MADSFEEIAFGNEKRPLRIDGLEIPCFILSQNHYVVSKNAAQKSLGYEGKSESWLRDLLIHINKFYPISELINRLEKSFIFKSENSAKSVGLDSMLFIEICESLLIAKKEGFLSISQLKYAKSAERILAFLNADNINLHIDEASGFKFYKETAIDHLSNFLTALFNDNAFEWIKTLEEDFLSKILQIKRLDWSDMQDNPQIPGKIIYEIIFSRISNELLQELRANHPIRRYKRKNYLPQDNQHPRLKEYVEELQLMLTTAVENWNIFLPLLNRAHPKNTDFPKFPYLAAYKDENLSTFNKILKLMS